NDDGNFQIDSICSWPIGRSFQTPSELKALLKADREAYVRGLTEKLMIYALGRGIERYDRPAVTAISAELPSRNYKFSELVLGIVNSLPFQMRRASAPSEAKIDKRRETGSMAGGRLAPPPQ